MQHYIWAKEYRRQLVRDVRNLRDKYAKKQITLEQLIQGCMEAKNVAYRNAQGTVSVPKSILTPEELTQLS